MSQQLQNVTLDLKNSSKACFSIILPASSYFLCLLSNSSSGRPVLVAPLKYKYCYSQTSTFNFYTTFKKQTIRSTYKSRTSAKQCCLTFNVRRLTLV